MCYGDTECKYNRCWLSRRSPEGSFKFDTPSASWFINVVSILVCCATSSPQLIGDFITIRPGVKRMIQQLCDSNLTNYVLWTVAAKTKTNPAVFAVLMCHWVISMAVMICDTARRQKCEGCIPVCTVIYQMPSSQAYLQVPAEWVRILGCSNNT